jgi:hypothetical protein
MKPASDEAAADLGAITFRLPAEPLPATNRLFLAALRELQRAGGPFAPSRARHVLADHLLVRLLSVSHACTRATALASSPQPSLARQTCVLRARANNQQTGTLKCVPLLSPFCEQPVQQGSVTSRL